MATANTPYCAMVLVAYLSAGTNVAANATEYQDIALTLTPLRPAQLDALRGGFVQEGLRFSFDMVSTTRVDGEIQAQTVLRIPDLDNAGDLATTPDSEFTLLQLGPANLVAADLIAPLSNFTDIIQNTVDNTVIEHARALNIQIQGLTGLRAATAGTLIDRQTIESLP